MPLPVPYSYSLPDLVTQALSGEYIPRPLLTGPPSGGVTVEGMRLPVSPTAGGGIGGGAPPPPTGGASPSASQPPPKGKPSRYSSTEAEKVGLGKKRPIGYSTGKYAPKGKAFLPEGFLKKGATLALPAFAGAETYSQTPEQTLARGAGAGNGLDYLTSFSNNLLSGLSLGLVQPETLAAGERNIGNALWGYQQEPMTAADRQKTQVIAGLNAQIADLARQIVANPTAPDAVALRDKHDKLIELARRIDSGEVPAEVGQAVMTQPPETGGQVDLNALLGRGGKISGPYVHYGFNAPSIPNYVPPPDFTAARPQDYSLNPDMQRALQLQGLASGGLRTDPMSSPAALLANVGLGALGGQALWKQMQQQYTDKNLAQQNDFKQWLAQQQQQGARLENIYNLDRSRIESDNARIQAAMRAKEAEQLQPKFSGGNAIVPSLENGKINYNIQNLGLAGMLTRLAMLNPNAVSSIVAPTELYKTLLASPGGVDEAARVAKGMEVGGPLQQQLLNGGASPATNSDTLIAQLMDAIRVQNPTLYNQLVTQTLFLKQYNKK